MRFRRSLPISVEDLFSDGAHADVGTLQITLVHAGLLVKAPHIVDPMHEAVLHSAIDMICAVQARDVLLALGRRRDDVFANLEPHLLLPSADAN